MYLTHLSLTNFRAFARLDMDIPRRTLLLVGNNAQGKTSVLEAVFFLAAFTSLHASNDRQMINFVAGREPLAVGRLVADYQRAGTRQNLEVRLIQEQNGGGAARFRKEILLNGVRKSAYEAVGHFSAVSFLPQMTRIIEGPPDERRRYLNLALSQTRAGYSRVLSEYAQIITQRNALLKQLGERGGDPVQLAYWDELLCDKASFLIEARAAAVRQLEKLAARVHARLSRGQEVLQLNYQPSYDPLPRSIEQMALAIDASVDRSRVSREDIRAGMLRRLASVRAEEIARGVTTLGPHRDEMRILANGIDLGDYGSRGQVRTALLSLKLAEAQWMHEHSGEWPVLLLDEITAELDEQRRMDLMEMIGECEQTLLTTTDLKIFAPDFQTNAVVWRVHEGQVRAEQPAGV